MGQFKHDKAEELLASVKELTKLAKEADDKALAKRVANGVGGLHIHTEGNAAIHIHPERGGVAEVHLD